MSGFDLYVFILCFIVFSMLVVMFSYLIATIVKLTIRLTKTGERDEEIKTEYLKERKKGCLHRPIGCVVSIFLCVVMVAAFAFSMYVNLSEDTYFDSVPTLKVITSSSMARKNENNDYLFDNKLDNQLQVFDMVLTYRAPKAEELKVYDIIVYEVDGKMVIHRIVDIEEPNDKHPGERYFLCQGDSLNNPDRFPVYYSQIKGIYKNQKIPFVGSFILFMQSPAGWLCVLLVVFAVIVTPMVEKKLRVAENERLKLSGITEIEPEICEAQDEE